VFKCASEGLEIEKGDKLHLLDKLNDSNIMQISSQQKSLCLKAVPNHNMHFPINIDSEVKKIIPR
jgi:hypothetical protein